jgi:signal transduction histidine kinase
LIGEDWFTKLIPPADRERARVCLESNELRPHLRGIEQAIVTRDGRLCQVRWSNTTLKDDQGNVSARLCIGLDITDLVQTQQQLVQAERLAAIGETVTGLAHESRNALQKIRSGIEVLELTFGDQPDVLKDLQRIDKAAEDLRALLDEVRSYAAPIVLERQKCDLRRTWRSAWEELRQTAPPGRSLVLQEHLPGLLQPVYADQRKLDSVFRNLFQNSLECCSGPIWIDLYVEQNPQGTRLEVIDHGPGITFEQAHQVFRAFYTTKATGTGLGLAICRRILEAHGGTIQLDTQQRRTGGACFVIWLPANPSGGASSILEGTARA